MLQSSFYDCLDCLIYLCIYLFIFVLVMYQKRCWVSACTPAALPTLISWSALLERCALVTSCSGRYESPQHPNWFSQIIFKAFQEILTILHLPEISPTHFTSNFCTSGEAPEVRFRLCIGCFAYKTNENLIERSRRFYIPCGSPIKHSNPNFLNRSMRETHADTVRTPV